MSLGDRLGFAGLIMAFLGIAVPLAFSDKRWLGRACFVIAAFLCVWWVVLEVRRMPASPRTGLAIVLCAGAIIGAAAAGIIWSSFRNERAAPSLTLDPGRPATRQEIEDIVRKALGNDKPQAPPLGPTAPDLRTGLDAISAALSQKGRTDLLHTARDLRRIAVQHLANAGCAKFITDNPVQNINALKDRGYVPSDWADAYDRFFQLQDRLLNSMGTNQSDFASLNVWGLETLRILRSIPLSSHVVIEADLPLYEDSVGKSVMPCVGLMLKAERPTPDTSASIIQVFPTTKERHYEVGMLVSWEWDMRQIWPKTAWYQDPASGKFVRAFDNSATFSGANINEFLDSIK